MAIGDRTRKLLWGRGADRCALCSQLLSADPVHPDDRHAVLGEECHIVARSPGGSRSGEIDADRLDDYDNLILLCATDHTLIDAQPHAYTSERLRSIKLTHEQRMRTAPDLRNDQTRVWFNVPHDARYFIGREVELERLRDALGGPGPKLIMWVIAGLGGVGKSQLAARYVHRFRESYGVIAWIRAEDGGLADLSSLASELGEGARGLSPQERAAKALRWLSHCQQRWLLVLDNVDMPQQIGGCCPSSGNGRVLITTRHREIEQFGPVLDLAAFDDATAADYLRLRSNRPDDLAARALANAVGGLPLALSHAGAYCATGTSFADYRKLLGELPAAQLFDTCPEASYQQTVATTWQVSIRAAGDVATLARPVLQMASYVAPDEIPRRLFRVLLGGSDEATARKRLSDALSALHRFCLIDVDDQAVSIHRLLQKTVRDAMPADDQSAALAALRAVVADFPTDPSFPGSWSQSEQLVPHAFAIAETLPEPGYASPQLIGLLNRACRHLNWAERGYRAVQAAQVAADHAERLLGCEHPETLQARSNLAEACHWVGRSAEAIAIQEPLVADCARILGTEHLETLHARNSLTSLYRSEERITDALVVQESLVADCTRVFGTEHVETLSAQANLAALYCSANRLDEAVVIEEEVARQRTRILGAEHPDTLTALHNLAYSYEDSGRAEEAVTIGEHVLAESERILGNEHPNTVRARSNLTYSYRSVGRVDDAIRLGEIVLAERERILGPEHPDTASARANLARSYRAAERAEGPTRTA